LQNYNALKKSLFISYLDVQTFPSVKIREIFGINVN